MLNLFLFFQSPDKVPFFTFSALRSKILRTTQDRLLAFGPRAKFDLESSVFLSSNGIQCVRREGSGGKLNAVVPKTANPTFWESC